MQHRAAKLVTTTRIDREDQSEEILANEMDNLEEAHPVLEGLQQTQPVLEDFQLMDLPSVSRLLPRNHSKENMGRGSCCCRSSELN